MVILYDDADKAVKAFKALKDSSYENKQLMVLLLPAIQVVFQIKSNLKYFK
jgi:hypothetical protein